MKFLKGALVALIVLAAAAGGIGYFLRGEVGEAMYARAVSQNVGRNAVEALPGGLHVALCGTGSPLPDPVRMGPCTAVIAGKRLFIVDIGSGAARNFGPMGLPTGSIEAVLLTHFHSDHIDGLGELMMLRRAWMPWWRASMRPMPSTEIIASPITGPTSIRRRARAARRARSPSMRKLSPLWCSKMTA
jgi:ribonuclease Z